ncbi:MAG: ArsI/CadI family heavy metal resistance metalloenzyme [Myxococcota bacterium]
MPRIHVALAVRSLDASLPFYRALLGVEPSKEKPGYAKFEPTELPVNLTLNETRAEIAGSVAPAHFGVEVESTEAVQSAHGVMRAGGFATLSEEGVTCCFAVQDKVWVVDPDGHRWEVFVRHADAEVHSLPPEITEGDEGRVCCP